MSEKTVVVQGAICKCQFGQTPDKLKVLSHKKEYANDSGGTQKLIASTKDIGATFEKNTFGSCKQQNNRACVASVLEWQNYYKNVQLSNGGYILLEDSKAVCAVAGTACIEIEHHGQAAELSKQNVMNADNDVLQALNPLVNMEDMLLPERTHAGFND